MLHQYQNNYQSILIQIRNIINPNHQLVIATMYKILEFPILDECNHRVREVMFYNFIYS